MFRQYSLPIIVALLLFPFLAFIVLIPFAFRTYRRFGQLPRWRTFVFYTFIYYSLTMCLYIILPLPQITPDFCTIYQKSMQLRPFNFINDIAREVPAWTARNVLTSGAFLQIFFNILLFVPFGIYMHYYFERSFLFTTLLGFGVSLAFETTQLTGIWYLYPCPYRLFDVDDLIVNTFGAMLGYGVGYTFLLLPSPRGKRATSMLRVRVSRRFLAWFFDLSFISILSLIAFLAVMIIFYTLTDIHPSVTPYAQLILQAFTWFFSFIDFLILPLLLRGSTIGKYIVGITLDDNQFRKPRFHHFFLYYASYMLPLTTLGFVNEYLAVSGKQHLSDTSVLLLHLGLSLLYIAPMILRKDMRPSLGHILSRTHDAVIESECYTVPLSYYREA